MEKKIYLSILFVLFSSLLFAQKNNAQIKQASVGKGLIYSRERLILGEGNTSGLVLGYQWAKLKSYYKTTYYQISVGYLRNPKETRSNITASSFSLGRSFIYGKQNALLKANLLMGGKKYLTEKDAIKGVAVGISYAIGPELGVLKPYYVEYFSPAERPGKANYIKYSTETAEQFLDISKINGAAPFSQGLKEVKIQPGVHAKLGLHFDWGAFDEYVRALEVGVSGDFFAKKMPILVENTQNKRFFINLYANFQLGKRK
jgi:hypothetical protein